MAKQPSTINTKRLTGLLLCLVLLFVTFVPATAFAENDQTRTIRVGYFAFDGYHEIADNGQKCGYGYDFLALMRRYAPVNYEYVGYDKTWNDMQQMLLSGEIDMVTAAHKTADREELFDYSLPIGTTSVKLNVRADEERYIEGDYRNYDGIVIGIMSGDASGDKLESFAKENHFTFVAKYYDGSEALSEALSNGEVDGIAVSSLHKSLDEKTIAEFDTEFFYAIVKKGNTELLNIINDAIRQMNSVEGDWKNSLYYSNYLSESNGELHFTEAEQAFIRKYSNGAGKLVFAVDTGWVPISWKASGEFKGVIPDMISYCMDLCGMDYEFADRGEEISDASVLANEEVNMYFGYSLSEEVAENDGFVASDAILDCGSAYLVRKGAKEIKTVAICSTTPYLNTRLLTDNSIILKEYPNTVAAKDAVIHKEADAAYLYDYDAEYTVNHDITGSLAYRIISGGDIYIRAVMRNSDDRTLMSIWMKCLNHMTDAEKNAIVSRYISHTVTSITIKDYAYLYPFRFCGIGVLFCILLATIIHIVLNRRKDRKHMADQEEKIEEITALNSQLKQNQEELEAAAAEQEAQFQEIISLNDQLQENQVQLEKAVENARAANKSKSDFLSRMSHDIRTPMNVIVGMTEIAKRHFDDSDKVADCLNKINMESVHLQTLINDVLDISAIESGKLTIRKEEVRVKDIIENMNVSMASLVQTKSIDYVYEQGNLFFPYMNTDSLRISQLYLNLLSNAVKYTPAGGRVKFEIWQNLTDAAGLVELHARISDTGMGMSEEFMETMYTEFSRATDTRVNKIQGTGLGLAIVKQIADLMDGTIEVQSELNKGTIFHVVLPIEIIEKTDAKNELADEEIDYEQLKGLRALVAEDNDFNYEIAEELLSDYGMILERAEDGAVALDKMDSSEAGYYDLILMDMQMPVMDGLEATRKIRKLNREDARKIPIIAMTANAFAEDALACREAGMDSHVAKPIKLKFLLETILKIRKERLGN